MSKIEIDERDFQDLLITSFRYCLGRQTGISQECSERLIKFWKNIEPVFQEQIQRDIQHAIKHDLAGDICDISCWKNVLKLEIDND